MVMGRARVMKSSKNGSCRHDVRLRLMRMGMRMLRVRFRVRLRLMLMRTVCLGLGLGLGLGFVASERALCMPLRNGVCA